MGTLASKICSAPASRDKCHASCTACQLRHISCAGAPELCVCVCDLVMVATYTSYYVHTYTRVFYFRKLGSAQWANVASIHAETRAALIELEYVETVSILLQQDGLGHDLARLCLQQK